MNICITHPPAGEAPESVRAEWVGLVLPVDDPQGVVSIKTVGVCSGPKSLIAQIFFALFGRGKIERGYRVRSAVAIDLLSKKSVVAANWWRENTPHLLKPSGRFLFQEESAVEHQEGETSHAG